MYCDVTGASPVNPWSVMTPGTPNWQDFLGSFVLWLDRLLGLAFRRSVGCISLNWFYGSIKLVRYRNYNRVFPWDFGGWFMMLCGFFETPVSQDVSIGHLVGNSHQRALHQWETNHDVFCITFAALHYTILYHIILYYAGILFSDRPMLCAKKIETSLMCHFYMNDEMNGHSAFEWWSAAATGSGHGVTGWLYWLLCLGCAGSAPLDG